MLIFKEFKNKPHNNAIVFLDYSQGPSTSVLEKTCIYHGYYSEFHIRDMRI